MRDSRPMALRSRYGALTVGTRFVADIEPQHVHGADVLAHLLLKRLLATPDLERSRLALRPACGPGLRLGKSYPGSADMKAENRRAMAAPSRRCAPMGAEPVPERRLGSLADCMRSDSHDTRHAATFLSKARNENQINATRWPVLPAINFLDAASTRLRHPKLVHQPRETHSHRAKLGFAIEVARAD